MAQQLCTWLLILVHLYLLVAVEPRVLYDCPDSGVQSSSKCDKACTRALGDALIGLYGGLSGSEQPLPWMNVQPGSMCQPCSSSNTDPGSPKALPSYCCWPGVYCCSEDISSFVQQNDSSGCWADTPAAVHSLAMRGWNLTGSFSKPVMDSWALLSQHGLHSLDLSSNAISGSIPRSIGRLKRMRSLNLNLNRLTGPLPEEMSELATLEHFYASFNSLSTPPGSTQPLAGRFCKYSVTRLYSLILRANSFTGTVNMSHCEGLGLLDVQDNRFYGHLPIGITNQGLISLRATNNMFNTSIPEALWRLPQLATLEMANNALTGTLSPFMGTVNNLVNLRLGNNSLRGTIPGNVTTNSQMLLLELYDNPLLQGTLPDVSKMVGIRTLDLHNTSLSGSIPEALGTLPYLERVDISMTQMRCCANQSQADALAAHGIHRLLPTFLRFNNRLQLFDTLRNTAGSEVDLDRPTDLLCGSVERRPQPEAAWNVMHLPVTNNAVKNQRWTIGPMYSYFKNCTCTPAFVPDTSTRVPVTVTSAWCNQSKAAHEGHCLEAQVFKCVPREPPQLTLMQQVAVGIAVAFCSVLLAVMANTCMAHASKVRRYFIRARTRLQGTPKHGRMSLVVTDIEGYSEIFKRAPEVMFRALVMHNSVIRNAKYANCGCVLEQEGDSFTLAFYSAFDAVAFCLQAQQALLSAQWPEGLGVDEPGRCPNDSTSARRPSRLHRLSQLLMSGARRKSQQSKSAASSQVSEGESISLRVSPSMQLSQVLASRLAGLKTPAEPPLFAGLRVRMGVCTGDVPSGTPIKSSALFQLAKVVSDFGNGGQVVMDHVTFASVKESLTVLGAVEAAGINYTRLAMHRSLWTSLKVMMGCTSPLDPAEEAVVLDMGAYYMPQGSTRSTDQPEALDLACYPVLDHATDDEDDEQQQQQPGGCRRSWRTFLQQLRSSSTATSSATTASTSKQVAGAAASASGPSSRPPWGTRWSQMSSLLGPHAASGGRAAAASVSLPLPQQQQRGPSLMSHTTASTISAAPAAGGGDAASGHSVLGRVRTLRRIPTTSTAAEGRVGSSSSAGRHQRDWNNVRLFQVLAPSLTGRAHVWQNKLNIKDGWRAYDMPFFDAPGSAAVSLSAGAVAIHHASTPGCLICASRPTRTVSGPVTVTSSAVKPASGQSTDRAQGLSSSSSLALHELPAVTMVFMSAENPEQLVRRRRSFTPKVQALLHQAVRDALRRRGGYLCRVQEGDLRFMIAFASPVAALEWCLLVQEAAMYLPWPAEPVLLYEGCTVERDGQGAILFRGPRIKMGVCEGVPSSIFSDHEGRADYHGPAVNMAARYADKGAKGGQIACSIELARKVMAAWSSGSSSSDNNSICQDSTNSSVRGGAAAAAAGTGTGCLSPDSTGVRRCSTGSSVIGLASVEGLELLQQELQSMPAVQQPGAAAAAADCDKLGCLSERSSRQLLQLNRQRHSTSSCELALPAVQQQLGRLPIVRSGRQTSAPAAVAAAGEAGGHQCSFALPSAPRAPVQVEFHRLGLFAFKGGPAQQEMVQVVPSHLLGRLDITAQSAVAASRKGQQLQQLDGRIGDAVTVQLSTLAQEYKAQLPERLLVGPARGSQSKGSAPVATDGHGKGGSLPSIGDGSPPPAASTARAEGFGQQQQQHHVKWGSSGEPAGAVGKSIAGHRLSSSAAAYHQVHDPLRSLRAMSDITPRFSARPSAPGGGRTAAAAAVGTGARSSSVFEEGSAAVLDAQPPSVTAGCKSSSVGGDAAAPAVAALLSKSSNRALSSSQGGHLALTVSSGNDAAFPRDGNLSSSGNLAQQLAQELAAVAAVSSGGGCIGVMRHDSFGSVASGDAAAVDEARSAACQNSKLAATEEQQLVAAEGGAALQQEMGK